MNRTTISSCHGLKVIPLSALSRFVRIRSRVWLRLVGEPLDMGAVPGTIVTSAGAEEERIKKKITFERSDVSAATADMLENMRRMRLVAIYTDESGRGRVAGSPDWPLTLAYNTEGGVFTITLQGEDMRPDGFIE